MALYPVEKDDTKKSPTGTGLAVQADCKDNYVYSSRRLMKAWV